MPGMKVEMFDDRFSVIHLIYGIAIGFTDSKTIALVCFVLYTIFQLIEHMYKYNKEPSENFIGDIIEFVFGIGVGYLLSIPRV